MCVAADRHLAADSVFSTPAHSPCLRTANPALCCRIVACAAQRGGHVIASTGWRAVGGNGNYNTSTAGTTNTVRRRLVPVYCRWQGAYSGRIAGVLAWLHRVGELQLRNTHQNNSRGIDLQERWREGHTGIKV